MKKLFTGIRIFTLICVSLLGMSVSDCSSNNSGVEGDGGGLDPASYSISPTSAELGRGQDHAVFTVRGGSPPFAWRVSDPALGTVNDTDGRQVNYRRIGTTQGVNTLTVTDSRGNQTQAVAVQEGLTLNPGSGTLAHGVNQITFSVIGGVPPYRWSVGNSGLGQIGAVTDTSAQYVRPGDVNGTQTIRVTDSTGAWTEAMLGQD